MRRDRNSRPQNTSLHLPVNRGLFRNYGRFRRNLLNFPNFCRNLQSKFVIYRSVKVYERGPHCCYLYYHFATMQSIIVKHKRTIWINLLFWTWQIIIFQRVNILSKRLTPKGLSWNVSSFHIDTEIFAKTAFYGLHFFNWRTFQLQLDIECGTADNDRSIRDQYCKTILP